MISEPLRGGVAAARALLCVPVLMALTVSAGCSPSHDSGTVLRVALWAGGDELETERRVADLYESRHPGVRVVLESAPNGYEERLLTSIAAGRPPDVYLMDSPDIPTFVDRGLAVDLAPYSEALGFDGSEVFAEVVNAFGRGGSLFALPKDFTPMVIFANRGVLRDSGVEVPSVEGWTWDDFTQAARRVNSDEDGDGRPNAYGFDFPRNLYQWLPFVWSAGGDILGEDASGVVVAQGFMDSPPALATYAFLTRLAEDGLTPGAQFVQRGDPAREARFATGKQAFLLSGHWTLRIFRSLVDDGALDLAILPIPHHPSLDRATTVLYASGWAVPPNAPNRRRAIHLVGFLASAEAQRIRAEAGLAIPSLARVAAELAAADSSGVEAAFLRLVEGSRMTWGATVRDFSRIEALAVEIMDRRLLAGEPLSESASDVARRVDEALRR